jgi:thiamine-monophosphate kinase
MFDENRLVRKLSECFGRTAPALKKGIGDDAAVIQPKGSAELWVITTDMLLEDVDFRRGWLTPEQLGHKSLAVNLSDLAAMGARPRFYTVALAIPKGISESWIARYYEGLTALGDTFGAVLIGGDLSGSGAGIQICITALGESLRKKLVYRSGARTGDVLFVTGVLGKAAAGLSLLERDCRRGRTGQQREALEAHMMPRPRCQAGLWLAQRNYATSMMDLSDGLSVDLHRLCTASGVGAEIDSDRIPVFPESRRWDCDPIELALHGGEDFELLFSVRPDKAASLSRGYPKDLPPLTRIGELNREAGVVTLRCSGTTDRLLPQHGFDHFRHQRTSAARRA